MEHLLFFQYGDFAADYRRFLKGGAEQYRDQWLTVQFIADLSRRFRVTTLVICDRPHREVFSPTLCSIGIDIATAYRASRLLPLLARLAPDRMILRTPHRHALLWARLRGILTLPVFADIFTRGGWRHNLQNRLLRWGLSGPNVGCVSNHSLNASLSLHDVLKLEMGRIVPWDYPPLASDLPAKPAFPDPKEARLFYAGIISEDKGVGDLLGALVALKAEGQLARLDLAGEGDLADWRAKARALGLGDHVRFLDRLENAEVRARMRAADIVVVPSRHSYAEGLPSTISEALAARTPLLVSDHPAFAGRLRDGLDCLAFAAADPQSLARQITRLLHDPELQISLSETAPAALIRLGFGQRWTELAMTFLDRAPADFQRHGRPDAWPGPQNLQAMIAQNASQALIPQGGAK